ncbi:TPA: hypothetical protein ACH3X3_002515 [Trebouxia sp. C0006]
MATARWKIYSCQNAAEAFIGKDSQYSYSLFRNEYSTLPQGTPQCCLRAVPVSQLDSVRKVFAAGVMDSSPAQKERGKHPASDSNVADSTSMPTTSATAIMAPPQ